MAKPATREEMFKKRIEDVIKKEFKLLPTLCVVGTLQKVVRDQVLILGQSLREFSVELDNGAPTEVKPIGEFPDGAPEYETIRVQEIFTLKQVDHENS